MADHTADPTPEVVPADVLTVPCTDCLAVVGIECYSSIGTHASRRYAAARQHLERGTCALCGRWLVRGSVDGGPVEVWHPVTSHAAVCPPMPDPAQDWNGYALALQSGTRPGHPGAKHFVAAEVTT